LKTLNQHDGGVLAAFNLLSSLPWFSVNAGLS